MARTTPHPPDRLTIRDGRLFIEECDAVKLLERFGSPLFVFSEAQLRDNYRRFRDAFSEAWPDGPIDVMPAMKANTLLAIRHLMSREGAGADIYSPEELEGALRSGVDPERCSVNGGGKPKEHLRRCIEEGVRITVEDVHEIDWIQKAAAILRGLRRRSAVIHPEAKTRLVARISSMAPGITRRYIDGVVRRARDRRLGA